MENSGKTAVFSGRIWPDWGNTAWADMAGLGSIGLVGDLCRCFTKSLGPLPIHYIVIRYLHQVVHRPYGLL